MADLFSGLAEGLSSGQAIKARRQNAELQQQQIGIQQQELGMKREEFEFKKKQYDREEQQQLKQEQLREGLNQAFSSGGYESAMEFLKHEDMQTYMAISKGKAEVDKSITDATTSKYASEKEKQEATKNAYMVLGRFGASLLKVPAEERPQAYQQVLPVIKQLYPDAPDAYDEKAQTLMMVAMGVSMPDSQLYASQKKAARAQTAIGKIDADIRKLADEGVSDDDPAMKALKTQLKAEVDNSTEAQLNAAKNAKGEDDLRNQYLAYTKNFTTLRDQYKQTLTLETKLKDPSYDPSSVDDMGLIYNVMKSKSPESTVMPGEYATGEKAGGWDDKSFVLYNKAVKGQLLSPKVREQYIKSMHELYDAQKSSYDQFRSGITDIATRRGLDPKNIVIDLAADESSKQSTDSVPESWKQQVKALNPDYSDADIAAAWQYTQKQKSGPAMQQSAPAPQQQEQEPVGEGNPPWQANRGM